MPDITYENKIIKLVYSTDKEDWINKIINTLDSYKLKPRIKHLIMNDLKKNFIRFLHNPNREVKDYVKWLLIKNPRLNKYKSKNMCQALNIKSKKNKSTGMVNNSKYNLGGSGISHKFCINGNRTLIETPISKTRRKYYNGKPAIPPIKCNFVLNITLYKGAYYG